MLRAPPDPGSDRELEVEAGEPYVGARAKKNAEHVKTHARIKSQDRAFSF